MKYNYNSNSSMTKTETNKRVLDREDDTLNVMTVDQCILEEAPLPDSLMTDRISKGKTTLISARINSNNDFISNQTKSLNEDMVSMVVLPTS